jgi:hypothetical protein
VDNRIQPAVDRAWERLLAEPSPLDTQYRTYSGDVVEWQAEKFHHDLVDLDDLAAQRALTAQLQLWLARALSLLANHPLPEVHVTWTPSKLPGAGREDTWMNEFTAHPTLDRELTPAEWELYTAWWESSVSGTILSVDDREEVVDIRLDRPALGTRFIRLPYDTACLDPVSVAVDDFRRQSTLGGCYDYEHGCRCASCLEFEAAEA